jgi:hypothetical protein
VDDEPVEPRLEAGRIAQVEQIAPGSQERLLRGVLGPMAIAKDAVVRPCLAASRSMEPGQRENLQVEMTHE